MQSQSYYTLLVAALSIGFIHTLIGPDHYLPFVALGKSNKWTDARTLSVTFLCGLGHVVSSLAMGAIGIALGASVGALENVDSSRSDIVKWMFLVFGVCYTIYGIKLALVQSVNVDSDAESITHAHAHSCRHCHNIDISRNASFWVLFIIFLFGPCEVLIPLLIYPAANFNWYEVFSIALAFSLSTVLTMILAVAALLYGMRFAGGWTEKLERWNHAITGAILIFCAILMFALD